VTCDRPRIDGCTYTRSYSAQTCVVIDLLEPILHQCGSVRPTSSRPAVSRAGPLEGAGSISPLVRCAASCILVTLYPCNRGVVLSLRSVDQCQCAAAWTSGAHVARMHITHSEVIALNTCQPSWSKLASLSTTGGEGPTFYDWVTSLRLAGCFGSAVARCSS
jgi:hypothetical protein